MEIVYSLLVAAHLIGVSLLVGTFFVQMRAKLGFRFSLMLIGASIQLVSGLALYGLQIAFDDPNHMKLGIKTLIAVAVFVASLVAFVQQRRLQATRAGLVATADGGIAQVSAGQGVVGVVDDSRLKPLFHVAGGLAVVNLLVATLWR
ncbi:hypothetical protein [Agrococcus jejuensis]|uniref:Uncharacterized protein n=1 Tax=Agrococcus jejuensis TaxID=399736 RepID=A0A1G8ETU8_9MICO|nr:hypothetical protein [Agrococcus jejuensis]SDH73308.1 hypothetical protein SAMN04489720_2188 [Agrococcus jejuensis]